jgi:hypothetical protein
MDRRKMLNVQLQPERAVDTAIRRLVDAAATLPHTDCEISEGWDDGHYVNLTYTSPDPRVLWAHLRAQVYTSTALGESIRRSTIVTCEGERGWDDSRLLHHFDASETPDPLS